MPKQEPQHLLDDYVGRADDGRWFVTAAVEETQPGVWETILTKGWFPGMPAGWQIVSVDRVDNRPRYTVVNDRGKARVRCMRRLTARTAGKSGWCLRSVPGDGAACYHHRHGEGPRDPDRRRAIMWYPGENAGLPDDWTVAGYIPCNLSSSIGGDTYFIERDFRGQRVVTATCLRKNKSWGKEYTKYLPGRRSPRCLRPAGWRTGRNTGPCEKHGGKSTGNGVTQLSNYLDPNFMRLISRAADTNPAIESLRNRIDLLRYAWWLFGSAIVRRQEMLEDQYRQAAGIRDDDTRDVSEIIVDALLLNVDRSVGIADITSLAGIIIGGTKVQSKLENESFRSQGKIWAAQTYALRMGMLLVEIADMEGGEARRRVARNIEYAMIRRGLLGEGQQIRWSAMPAEDDAAVAEEEQPDTQELVLQEDEFRALATSRPASQQEKAILEAMSAEQKRVAYKWAAQELGAKIFSLYPLIAVLDQMKVEEEKAGGPYKIKIAILKTIQQAQAAQMALDTDLGITFSQKEKDKIAQKITEAVLETIEQESPEVAARLMYGDDSNEYRGWMERKNDIILPTAAHEAVGKEAIKVVKSGKKRQDNGRG